MLQWLAQSTSQYHFVLQSLHKDQSLHKGLPSATLYHTACAKYFPVPLRTRKLAQRTSHHRFVLQSLHKVLSSTTPYYKACTQYFPVLLRTTKLAQSTSHHHFVLQSLHKVLPSTTFYYRACTKYFPPPLHTTKLAQSTSQYILLCTTKLAQSISSTTSFDNITFTTRCCGHFNGNCQPELPNTMAQRVESVRKHLRAALKMGTARAPNEVEAAPVAQTRFPPSTPGAILCDNTKVCAVSNAQK